MRARHGWYWQRTASMRQRLPPRWKHCSPLCSPGRRARLSLGGRVWKELANAGTARLVLATHGFDETATAATLEALLAAVLAGSASSLEPRWPGMERAGQCGHGTAGIGNARLR